MGFSAATSTASFKRYLFVTLAGVMAGFILASLGACTKKDTPENTYYTVYNSNVKGLDTLNTSDGYVHRVLSHISEGLLSYHPLKKPYELIPKLAEKMPTISKDGLTYTLKIKKGVKFQDDPSFPDGKGRELKAKDFAYSWKRQADPKNNSEVWWWFDDRIAGLNEWRKLKGEGKADYDTPVSGLQTPDDYTLVIKLTKPYFQFIYTLASPAAYVVAREAVEHYKDEYLNHPVGTGPFQLSEYIRNNKIVLVRNPNFRGDKYPSDASAEAKEKGLLTDAGQPIPFVEKVVFNEMVEDQTRWLNMVKGNLDTSGIPKDNFDSAIDKDGKTVKPELREKGYGLHLDLYPNVTYNAINMEDPFLGKHKLVRQAMALAVDQKTLLERFYNNRGLAAQSPIPPGLEGYTDDFKNPYQTHDLEKAKALLAKAGFPGGKGMPELVYESTNSATSRQMAEYFQEEMSKVGIKIKINMNTWPELTEKVKTKKAQIYGMLWAADYPDAENFLGLFYGKNISPGPNGSNYNNPEFNRIFEEAAKLPPGKERTKLYVKLRDIVVEDAPWIFQIHRFDYWLKHEWTKNYFYDSLVGQEALLIKVDKDQRVQDKTKL